MTREIHGPDGFRLRIVGNDPELLEMEASYGGSGNLPPEHLHPNQDERFEVLEGAVRAIVGGVERRYAAGEKFEVPKGTPHQMAGDGPARVRWQVRPALRTAEFFETLYGGGSENFLEEFSDEFRLTAV